MRRIYVIGIMLVAIVVAVLSACNFKDVLYDDDNHKINLLRLDLPKFDARYTIRLVDVDGVPVVDPKSVLLDFTGKDAMSLITDAGMLVMKDNNPEYEGYRTVRYGLLSLNLNPNYKIASHPVEFQICGSMPLTDYIVIPRMVRQSVAGDVNIDQTVVELESIPTLIAANKDDTTTDAVTVSGGDATKITSLRGPCGTGYEFVALYQSEESVSNMFSCKDINGEYEDYGIYLLDDPLSVAPERSKTITEGAYFVVVAKRGQMVESLLKINVCSNIAGLAASLPYTVTAADGALLASGTVSGIFPYSATIEQFYVPAKNPHVSVELQGSTIFSIRADSKRVVKIGTDVIPTVDFVAEVDNTQTAALRRCDISVVGACKTNKQIAFYPTLRFLYSEKDAQQWEWVESRSGRIVMMLEPDKDYSIRMSINNDPHEFTITTDQKMIEAMLRDQPNVGFELINNADATMKINVEYRDQVFCDLSI